MVMLCQPVCVYISEVSEITDIRRTFADLNVYSHCWMGRDLMQCVPRQVATHILELQQFINCGVVK